MTAIDNGIFHETFCHSDKKHVLMITNHGIHQWDIIPGLPDTGGQNVFVNQFTESLASQGYKITTVNRGGYPHPVTGDNHTGLVYKDSDQRILYIEDSEKSFIRKEDMADQLPELANNLFENINDEGIPVDLIISHYWDGAKLGVLLNEKLPKSITHIWVPHSTGAIKKRNVSPSRWDELQIDGRIAEEVRIAKQVNAIAYTSYAVQDSLKNDYGYEGGIFLPPCIVVDRFFPQEVDTDDEIWTFLSNTAGLPVERLKQCKIVTEISRTDTTKRKDILIEAFAKIHKKNPDTFLVIAIDDNEKELSASLKALIHKHQLNGYVAPIGNEWERMPTIYRISDVYCSPSIMEGFGMSVQEAAASKVPVVASALIPFAKEFLLNNDSIKFSCDSDMSKNNLEIGAGAILVQPDDIDGFATAISMLLDNDKLRARMGEAAYNISIPYFTWTSMIRLFLDAIAYSNWQQNQGSIAS